MGQRNAATFDGTCRLTIADTAALDLAGSLYFSAFVNFSTISGAQCVAAKSGAAGNISWQILSVAGAITFVVTADGTTAVPTASVAVSAGTWYFFEVAYDHAASEIKLAITAASAALGSWGTPVSFTGPIYNSTGPLQLAAANSLLPFSGSIHSATLWSAVPTTAQREFLFQSGGGREFWELDPPDKEDVVGFWSLKEETGSRLDATGNGLHLAAAGAGTITITTRTYTRGLEHATYGPAGGLRNLLAATATFQDLVGVATEADALPFIFVESIDTEAEAENRPFAVIFLDTTKLGIPTGRWSSGDLGFEIHADIEGGEDGVEPRKGFANRMGKLVEDLIEQQEDGLGRLFAPRISPILPFQKSAPAQTEDFYYVAKFTVSFGVES